MIPPRTGKFVSIKARPFADVSSALLCWISFGKMICFVLMFLTQILQISWFCNFYNSRRVKHHLIC